MEISRARHRAELVTDDKKALGEQLETATGERISAFEALEPVAEPAAMVPEAVCEDAGKVVPEPVLGDVQKAPPPKEMEFDLGL